MKQKHQQKFIIISIVLFILLNAPVLLVFNKSYLVMSMPSLYSYLFLVWGFSILLSYFIIKWFDE